MCFLFPRRLFIPCALCKTEMPHLMDRVVNCRKAKYRCCGCGHGNGIRIVGDEKGDYDN